MGAAKSSKTSVAGFSGVPYPYDNRYGIDMNQILLGGVFGKTCGGVCKGSPSNSPFYFREGLVIRDNYVFQNGRVGISWSGGDGSNGQNPGKGTQVVSNHVEVAKGTTCYSISGEKPTTGSSTNENRGYCLAGFGTNFTGNTGHINRQLIPGGAYMTVDGEGMLLQCSSGNNAVRNVLVGNDLSGGSSGYIGFYGLTSVTDNIIEGNKVNSDQKIGIMTGGSSPSKMTAKGNKCSHNTPKAVCDDPRAEQVLESAAVAV